MTYTWPLQPPHVLALPAGISTSGPWGYQR